MKIWVAFGDCGDYYCDSDHFLGAFTTEQAAVEAGQKYRESKKTVTEYRGRPHTYNVSDCSHAEYELDELNPDYFPKAKL